jgi:DNA repair protein RadC
MMTQTYNLTETDLFLDQDQQYVLRFRDMPVEDKPREKLIKFGPEILSAAELLALVFNVGNKKEDVLTLSRRLLREYGEKAIVDQTDATRVSKELGIPIVKACQVIACFELGRRFFQNSPDRVEYLRTARQVYNYLKDMAKLPKEHLRGLYLNSQYKLIHDEVISIGSLTANIVHPREVFKPALEHSASALILAHNHPSGDVRPSEADMEVTKQIVAAGKILGIELLDHVIVTKNKFASIKINHD